MRSAVWLVVLLGVAIGLLIGVGGYTFVYAKGGSYLTNDPAACANCHIMGTQYAQWLKSPHRSAAVCNDCHTPHDLIGKYATKVENGFRHSYGFTTGDFHEPIQIKDRSRRIAEANCRRCHAQLTLAIEGPHRPGQEMSCIRCHWDVGHF